MWSLFRGEPTKSIFQAEPGLELLKIEQKNVLINPAMGAWAVVSAPELVELLNPSGYLSQTVGEAAYQCGLAKKNGHSVYDSSAQADQLFFFEFDVSDECNLACVYCSSNARPVTRIAAVPPARGTMWIDRVIEHCRNHPTRKINLEFTGGEPLANIDLLSETTKYALEKTKEYGIETKILIVSNLTVVGPRQIEFLKTLPVTLNVSLDGDKVAHDGQRRFAAGPGTYDTVMRNFKRLKDAGVPVTTIQSTITSHTVDRLPEIAQFLLDLGYSQLSLHYMSLGGARPGATAFKADPRAYVDGLFEVFETKFLPIWKDTGIMPHTRMLALAYAYLLQPKRTYMCQRAPCGAGREIMAVKANGDVYGCACGPFVPDFIYGNIASDSFEQCQRSPNAVASASRKILGIPGCSTCLFRGWCQGGCPKDAHSRYGNILAPSGNCAMYRALWTTALETLLAEKYPEEAVHALAASYMR